MENRNFSIVKASAGSGKTYILTYNYIRLALKYPNYFKGILAVTFTNKATKEMKSRILETLELLAKGDHPMSMDLMKELHLSNSQLKDKANALLINILHNYSFFAVTTIDSFFQKIVRSFAREIGIQTGFNIELDQPKVISEVIDKMLSQMADDEQLVNWLTSFAIHQINQGKNWDTRKEMKRLSYELFNEFLVLNKRQVFKKLDEPEFMENFIKAVREKSSQIQNDYQSIGIKIKTILEKHALHQDDFSSKGAGVGGYMNKIANGEFKEPGANVKKAINEDKWYVKSSPSIEAIETALAAGLSDLVQTAHDYYFSNVREYLSHKQVIDYLYTFGLLSKISEEITNYREENDLLLISDFPVFLNEILTDSNAPYIYEKAGTRFQHYLIDEFQDTSGLQWNNFKPLVLDTLSAGNFSMVVGDIKQSIYRWRGGNWKILLNQVKEDIGQEYIKEESLKTNRRSLRNIVEFNNDFFDHAPQILEDHLTCNFGEAVANQLQIKAAYVQSAQELLDESSEGLIDIDFFNKEDFEAPDEYVINRLIHTLKKLQDANYELNDIAILVRKNPEGRQIARALMEYQLNEKDDNYRFDVISNESLYLKNNAAVHLILQGLNFVQHPSEPLSLVQLDYACDHYSIRSESLTKKNSIVLAQELSKMLKMNLSQLVEFIIKQFGLYENSSDHAYLMAFQDVIMDYLKFESDNLDDFVSWWSEQSNRAIQIADDMDAIRLMTIHKSKGLQFKAVILPFCNWGLDHSAQNEQLLWCNTEKEGVLSQLPFVPVKYKSELKNTSFDEAYYMEKSDIHLDNLNLLYVGLTRAEKALFITSPLSKSKPGN